MTMAAANFLAEHQGAPCAGVHIVIDLYDVQPEILRNIELIEEAMRACVLKSGATLIHIHLHRFGGGGGITGVAVLAESHISVHTWPEIGFAAFDVFMCGSANPHACVDVLRSAFSPGREKVTVLARGIDL